MSSYLQTAIKAIREASQVALKYYLGNIDVHLKEDKTPVTIADREAEAVIIRQIQKDFPDHSIYGEESGAINKSDEFIWIIDPIDGTKNFIAGIPFWGILLALSYHNEMIIGVSYLPVLDEMLWAEKNKGAYLNNKKVKVSDISPIKESMMSFGSLGPFSDQGYEEAMIELIKKTKRQRSFGDSYPYHLLASGKLEIVIEASIKIVDIAPFDIILKEAGGTVSDINGLNINMGTSSFLATNGRIHKDVLEFFNK